MAKRTYADTSNFRAPFDAAVLQGLGTVVRSYQDVANFRAGYDDGYFQDNSLFGLGAVTVPSMSAAPAALRRYLEAGAPMPTWRRDLGAATNQIPRWAWGLMAVGALALAYRGFKAAKKPATQG
jgi:hypothetical protein